MYLHELGEGSGNLVVPTVAPCSYPSFLTLAALSFSQPAVWFPRPPLNAPLSRKDIKASVPQAQPPPTHSHSSSPAVPSVVGGRAEPERSMGSFRLFFNSTIKRNYSSP